MRIRSASEPTPASTTTSREAERRQLTVMFVPGEYLDEARIE
jgi:hypothetical protein